MCYTNIILLHIVLGIIKWFVKLDICHKDSNYVSLLLNVKVYEHEGQYQI